MRKSRQEDDSPALLLIDAQEEATAQPTRAQEEAKEARGFSNDLLYWRTRAENRELVGTYENVQSCLLALRDIAKMTKKQKPIEDMKTPGYSLPHTEDGGYDVEETKGLLSQIRERALLTLKAIEETET